MRTIALADLPHLKEVVAAEMEVEGLSLSEEQVFELYRANWGRIDPTRLVGHEALVFDRLAEEFGRGEILL